MNIMWKKIILCSYVFHIIFILLFIFRGPQIAPGPGPARPWAPFGAWTRVIPGPNIWKQYEINMEFIWFGHIHMIFIFMSYYFHIFCHMYFICFAEIRCVVYGSPAHAKLTAQCRATLLSDVNTNYFVLTLQAMLSWSVSWSSTKQL